MDTYFIPVPLIGLTKKRSYKIIVELEQFRHGPIKDDTGNVREYVHVFRANELNCSIFQLTIYQNQVN